MKGIWKTTDFETIRVSNTNAINKITWAKIIIDAETILKRVQHMAQHDKEGVIPFVLTLIRFANHHNIFFELMGSFAEMEA